MLYLYNAISIGSIARSNTFELSVAGSSASGHAGESSCDYGVLFFYRQVSNDSVLLE